MKDIKDNINKGELMAFLGLIGASATGLLYLGYRFGFRIVVDMMAITTIPILCMFTLVVFIVTIESYLTRK